MHLLLIIIAKYKSIKVNTSGVSGRHWRRQTRRCPIAGSIAAASSVQIVSHSSLRASEQWILDSSSVKCCSCFIVFDSSFDVTIMSCTVD